MGLLSHVFTAVPLEGATFFRVCVKGGLRLTRGCPVPDLLDAALGALATRASGDPELRARVAAVAVTLPPNPFAGLPPMEAPMDALLSTSSEPPPATATAMVVDVGEK